MTARRYVRCDVCNRRIMLPRWAGIAMHNIGVGWTCMGCTGESPRELIEWAEDQRQSAAETFEFRDAAAGTAAGSR